MNVVVGNHRPPSHELVGNLMDELGRSCRIASISDLIEWYRDFETVHPFFDGNGRVGGVVVALYSHSLHPERGWLAPHQ